MRDLRIIVFALTFLFSFIMKGQDVIVKNDGSTIISKVLEVTQEYVKYQKMSNLQGPIYTIKVEDIMSINYANGEVELYGGKKSSETSVKNQLSDEDIYINDATICNFNDRSVRCEFTKPIKKIKWIYRLLNIHNQSRIGNKDGKLNFLIYQSKYDDSKAYISVEIQNSSEEMMYVDLNNTSFRCIKSASTYYVNSSTTTSTSSESGGSLNVGAITSALGIGGILGTLANGVNVGGGNTSGTSTTVYADRIIIIPPHSTHSLSPKLFYNMYLEEPYKTDFKFGDIFKYNQPESLSESPWEIVVSYSMESDLNTMRRYQAGIFISEEMSVSDSWEKGIVNETGIAPLHYFYYVKEE